MRHLPPEEYKKEKVRLEAKGVNRDSVRINKYESMIKKGWAGHIQKGILKQIKDGTNTTRKETEGDNMTKGEQATMANAYEPSHATTANPYNTQAMRDVSSGKSGDVGNAKAGDKVYNPKSNTRKSVQTAVEKRRKATQANQRAGSLDRMKSRIF
jgi:hypothetical protein